jgi:hypothetical protein
LLAGVLFAVIGLILHVLRRRYADARRRGGEDARGAAQNSLEGGGSRDPS